MKRTGKVTAVALLDVPLPEATDTYTVISHEFLMKTTRTELNKLGFDIKKEVYKANNNGNVATAQYRIEYGSDPDLGMLFTWANSYDKTMKFKCAVGGFVRASGASVISDTINNYNRKHTGNADEEARKTITDQIGAAQAYFAQLCRDKDAMKAKLISTRQMSEIIGLLYFEMNLISINQVSTIKKEYKKPRFQYTTPDDSLWTFYNHILVALAQCNPKNWMDQQKMVHMFIMDYMGINKFTQDPSDEIAEGEVNPTVDELEDAGLTATNDFKHADNSKIMETEEELGQDYHEMKDNQPTYEAEVPDEFKSVKPELTEDSVDELPEVVAKTERLTLDEIIEKYGDNLSQEEIDKIRLMSNVPADRQGLDETDKVGVDSLKINQEPTEAETEEDKDELPVNMQQAKAVIDLDAEEDEDWDKLEVAGIVTPITPHVESDQEYADRVSKIDTIEGEPTVEEKQLMQEAYNEDLKNGEYPEAEQEEEVPIMTIEDVNDAFPGQSIGSIVEIDDISYMLTAIDGDDSICALVKVSADVTDAVEVVEPEPVLPKQATEEELKVESEGVGDPAQDEVPTALNVNAIEEEVTPPRVDMDHTKIDILEPEEDVADDSDPIRQKIQEELLDIYGSIKEFTFEKKGEQYNVTLSTGEVVVLMETLVEVD